MNLRVPLWWLLLIPALLVAGAVPGVAAGVDRPEAAAAPQVVWWDLGGPASSSPTSGPKSTTEQRRIGKRTYRLVVPRAEADGPVPLLVGLHGFGRSAKQFERYWRIKPHAQRSGFLYALPDGLPDGLGRPSWHASDACCGAGNRPNDVRYLRRLINDVRRTHTVDDRRIYVLGKSNGGFMAHRLACEQAALITAFVSVSGAAPQRGCTPSRPVSMLQIHGTSDETVRYHGGRLPGSGADYPGAHETAAAWAGVDRCRTSTAPRPMRRVHDLDRVARGRETAVARFGGCARGTKVELWTMRGVGHHIDPTARLTPRVLSFLLARHR